MVIRLLAFIAALWASTATAQVACGPSIGILLALGNIGETQREMRMIPTQDGAEIQWIMWLNETTGSWTLTGTYGPITCLYAGGHSGYAGQTIADLVIGPAL